MKIVYGNLWESDCEIKAVTTNSFIRSDERLVMGRGAALQASHRFPGLSRIAGRRILREYGQLGKYGWLYLPEFRLGLFQVKHHWKERAELELNRFSCAALSIFLEMTPNVRVALNFPGIGNGRLGIDRVKPIVEQLPDQVQLFLLGSTTHGGRNANVFD
jgi:hypothetical protein